MADVTFGTALVRTGGRSSGFDYLRIVLSIAILCWHAVLVTGGPQQAGDFWSGPLRPLTFGLVPVFFALSGFLVSGSLFRNDLPSFLALRALRIVPALLCEVVISALIIGPALTALPLADYFRSPTLYSYFGNILGNIQYTLPGLFLDAPYANNVNAQLWTIPAELQCYLILTGLALFGIVRRPRMLLTLVVGAALGLTLRDALTHFAPVRAGPSGLLCVLCFLAGVSLYVWRGHVPAHRGLFAAALVLSWIGLSRPEANSLCALPVAYVTVWLGLQNPPRLGLLRRADYSYGVYLYHFPVAQALYALGLHSWAVNIPATLCVSLAAAALSWTLVESRVLDSKRRVLAALTRALAVLGEVAAVFARRRTGRAKAAVRVGQS